MRFSSKVSVIAAATLFLIGAGCAASPAASSSQQPSITPVPPVQTNNQGAGSGIDDSSLHNGPPITNYDPSVSSPTQ